MSYQRERAPSVGSANAPTAIANVVAATTVTNRATKEGTPQITTLQPASSSSNNPNVGHPQEQLEVQEAGQTDENIVYPTGPKLWLTFLSICLACFLNGLDLTIVAVAVPSLTDHFRTVADIGWYSAAYGLAFSSCIFFFSKCYSVFSTKHVYVAGLVIFVSGSAICTFAADSKMFIIGRAVAGLGASAYNAGLLKILRDMFPMSKQALMLGVVGASQSVGLVSAPMVGGLLIHAFTWRGCFGINLPLMALCIGFNVWFFKDPSSASSEVSLPFKAKLKKLDLASTVLVVPSIACLLMALNWGGITYGWKDWRIITLFVVFAVLLTMFAYLQHRFGEDAVIPPRLLKQRSVLGALWFGACLNGILAMTEYYISIYFQGVRGYTPFKSGLLGLPMIVGVSVSALLASAGITLVGYYFPFLFATSILAPIASGLLTTVDLDGTIAKPTILLGFLGAAVGLGMQGPALAIQTTLPAKDVTIGFALTGFGCGLGSAVSICISAALFQNRLSAEIVKYSPTTNVTIIEKAGLSAIRTVLGGDVLRDVLTGYNQAVVQTLYLPLGLSILTLVGAFAIERNSIKKKTS